MVTLEDLLETSETADLPAAVARAGSAKAWVAAQMFDARVAGVHVDTWDVAKLVVEVEAAIRGDGVTGAAFKQCLAAASQP